MRPGAHRHAPDRQVAAMSNTSGAHGADRNFYRFLHAGLNHISEGVTIFDRDLRLVACNERFLDLLEFPHALGAPGTPFAAFMRHNAVRGEYGPGNVEALVRERVERARRFEPHDLERVRPTGTVLQVRGRPIPDGGFVSVYTDITEHKRRQALIQARNEELEQRVRERTAELAESERRLRLILDAVPAQIAYLDRERVFRFANRHYSQLFELAPRDIVGKRLEQVIARRIRMRIAEYLERAFAGETTAFELTYTRRGGHHTLTKNTLIPELDGEGRVHGVYILTLDVTEERLADRALMAAQKMSAVGQLAGGLAHDFNNLLTVIIGNLVALSEDHQHETWVSGSVQPAVRAARQAADITRRLVAFARQEPLDPVPVDVTALVNETLPLLRRSLPGTIEVSLSLKGEPPFALVDPAQFESALVNLAFNARDAMPGGGQLKIEVDALRTQANEHYDELAPPAEYVRIGVCDTGTGFDPQAHERAFEPFFTTKKVGEGSGLGLSMVYGFIKQSSGYIRIDSEPGRGSTVRLLLPRASPAAAGAVEAVAHTTPATGAGRLVLLVEDEEDVRRVVRRQLIDLDYAVLEADSGVRAQRLVDEIRDIQVVVTDVMMPGPVDGRALARFVRRHRPELAVVLISGFVFPDNDATDWLREFTLLRKPFDKDELARALRSGLD
jgi:PAS domain S-box-containing protein